ncbi:FAD-dependent oxidoreductase [Nocardia alba]|uniref:2-polyprenyl-6-methoxyphenol hydroxylase-like FAD-dependent oxidoreductase n=1 Tax=Nocardia alba TaxID=225051 RepID=A0A4R1FV10_9NOCA|nr:2-polyprenyl-6-methoxyphenol hydroxylase-like oxidoreductase [Nocardia alba]TCJ97559.1 2-polyprenyl-6-methoxyphenol hydroxylase-like FAD-dependent oxidoreductase [Nocardia alba]
MVRRGEHAVVLGASMAGLLAARVLSDSYDRVTVVERDRLDAGPGPRRGVPQGKHIHALLPSGSEALESLFPGLLDELVAAGTKVVEDYTDFYFSIAGNRLSAAVQPRVPTYLPTRPHLEGHVRERVRSLPSVRIVDGHDVVGLIPAEIGDRITGVRVISRAPGSAAEVLACDLVVDATGRSSRTPAWLTGLGYETPPEEAVSVHIGYSSLSLRPAPGTEPETLVLIGPAPDRPIGMALLATEDDTWLFTATGYRDHHPGTTFDELVEFVTPFAPPHVLDALRRAEPLSSAVTYRYDANRRRRYDLVGRFPRGLIVMGDAMCGFNPIYAQGMSVAALQAVALRECLRTAGEDLERRFFRAAAQPVGVAWGLAVGADLTQPLVLGRRTARIRLVNGYVRRLLEVGRHDPIVAARFLRVSALLDHPSRLLMPTTIARVMLGTRRTRGIDD